MLERINEVIQQTWVLLSKWYKSTTAITITTTTRHVTEMIGHAFDHWYFLFISGVNGIYPPWFSCLHFVFNSTQTTDCIWRCLYWSKNQIHRGCFVAYCTYCCTHIISYCIVLYYIYCLGYTRFIATVTSTNVFIFCLELHTILVENKTYYNSIFRINYFF